ncbi:hypothetical protein AAZX31_13G070300 [Glycine max]
MLLPLAQGGKCFRGKECISTRLKIYCLKLAEELGVIVPNPWVTCFKAASLPAIVCLLMPLILYKLYPPEIKDTPEAPALAAKKLESMGLVIKNEWIMVGTMLLAVSLWIFGSFHLLLMTMKNYTCLLSSIDCCFFLIFLLVEFCIICVFLFCKDTISIASAVAAMIGLSILLLLGVLDWNNCWNEKSAWDTLAWFAILVGMASQLTNLGYVSWMSDCVANNLRSFSLSWPASVAVLQAAYFFIHYLFASQTGHVGALYSAVLAMHKLRNNMFCSLTKENKKKEKKWCKNEIFLGLSPTTTKVMAHSSYV